MGPCSGVTNEGETVLRGQWLIHLVVHGVVHGVAHCVARSRSHAGFSASPTLLCAHRATPKKPRGTTRQGIKR